VEPAQLERFLAAPEVDTVVLTHVEGQLGVQAPLAELARVVRARPDLHLLVDATHSLGALPLETDVWGLDLVLAASDGPLALPGGLSFAALSPRMLGRARGLGARGRQLDLVAQHEAQVRGAALLPLDPAQQEILARQLYRILHLEGLEHRWRRHAALAGMVAAWAEPRTDLALLACPAFRAAGQSCLIFSDGLEVGQVLGGLAAEGWYAGSNEAPERHLQIGHMGEITPDQLAAFLAVLERHLDLGASPA